MEEDPGDSDSVHIGDAGSVKETANEGGVFLSFLNKGRRRCDYTVDIQRNPKDRNML